MKNLFDVRFKATNDLVAIIGNESIANGQARLYTEDGSTPSEKSKIEMCQVIATYGGLAFVHCLQLPTLGIMVTNFDSMLIYILKDSIRKSVSIKNNSKNRVRISNR
ncbi:P2 family phage major capsid protein [Vibrio aestuarianus]|uniref:P2 family phage major capsid protein n=1 Tax=Vibrio aestuarianus TaxID=28171 RepID=UPI00237C83E0|nr:P2 family phage major capsid protein [Vibrio aestuarianus]MDE1253020.1 P2 family phage major capsid protein [Vibrio aestuarianus]